MVDTNGCLGFITASLATRLYCVNSKATHGNQAAPLCNSAPRAIFLSPLLYHQSASLPLMLNVKMNYNTQSSALLATFFQHQI